MKSNALYCRPWTLITVLASFAALPQIATAQDKPQPAQSGGDLEALFSGRVNPISLKMKDLNSTVWRRIKISGGSDKKEDAGLGGLMGAMFGGGGGLGGMMSSMMGSILSGVSTAGPDVYYTRGQTVVLGGETYLVAYQPQTKEIDFGMLMKMKDMESAPPPKPLTPDSPLVMSLLNLHNIGNLTGIRPFDLQTEIADSEAMAKTMEELSKEQAKEKKQRDSLFGGDSEPDVIAKPKTEATPSKPKPKSSKRTGK